MLALAAGADDIFIHCDENLLMKPARGETFKVINETYF